MMHGNSPGTAVFQMLTHSGMAHLRDAVFPFDALLELAPQAVLVVHERMVQLQPGAAVLPHGISHLLHQHITPCVSTPIPRRRRRRRRRTRRRRAPAGRHVWQSLNSLAECHALVSTKRQQAPDRHTPSAPPQARARWGKAVVRQLMR